MRLKEPDSPIVEKADKPESDFDIDIEIRTESSSIHEILPAWQELYDSDPHSHAVFLSPSWVMPWLDCNPTISPYFICIWKNAKLIGLLPMEVDRSYFGGVTILKLANQSVAGLGVPIIANGNHAEFMELVVNHLVSQKSADLIQLERVPSGGEPTGRNWNRRQSPAQYNSVLNLARDLENIGQKRSIYSRLHKETRANLKKLEAEGEYRFRVLRADSEDLNAVIDVGIEWKSRQLREQGRIGHLVGSPHFRKFLLETFNGAFSQNSNSMAAVLYRGKTPIAMALYVVRNEAIYGHFTVYNANFQQYAPGNIQLALILDWMKENGITRYDFLGYPEPYKERFSNEKIPLYDYVLPLTWKGRIAAQIMRIPFRTIAKRAFYFLPLSVRRAVIAWLHD